MADWDPLFGPQLRDQGWVPAPRYLLRRRRVLTHLAALPAGARLLEIGCGAGVLLQELARQGHRCSALESSPQALALAAEAERRLKGGVDLRDRPVPGWAEGFDAVLALEVLEHIEDDAAALREWRGLLRPGGLLLLSVPAHMARWNPGDEWAGHYRRYEREPLAQLLAQCGFELDQLECYGFPLANLLERLSSLRYRGGLIRGEAARERSSSRSGVDRRTEARLFGLIQSFPGRQLLSAALRLQERFLHTERGNGYIALARRM